MRFHYAVCRACHLKHLEYQHSKEYSSHACYGSEYKAFGEYLRQNHSWCGTYGSPYAYLCGAFLDGHHHYVAHADSSSQNGSYSNEPDEKVDTSEKTVDDREHHFAVESRDGGFVFRTDAMNVSYDVSYLWRDTAHLHVISSRHGKYVDALAVIILLSAQGERYGDGLCRVRTDAHSSVVEIHSYNLVIDITYFDALSAGVCAGSEQFLIYLLSNDTDVAFLFSSTSLMYLP